MATVIRKETVKSEEQSRRAKLFESFCEFLSSPHWTVPIDSFVEEYCLIFQPDSSLDSKKEKLRIFSEYKKLMNSMLESFLKQHELSREYLMEAMMHNAHKISPENFKFVLAVEEFDIFTAFMGEKNEQLNKLTMSQIQKEKELEDEKWRKIKRAQTLGALGETPKTDLSEKELMELAIKQSIEEERKRKLQLESEEKYLLQQIMEESENELKKKQREEDEEEDEMMKIAMRESMKCEEERLQLQRMNSQQEKPSESLIPEEPLKSAREQQSKQQFRIKHAKVKPMAPQKIEARIVETQQEQIPSKQEKYIPIKQEQIPTKQESLEKKQEQESLEDRQRRLKAQRDLFKKKENQQPDIIEMPEYPDKKGNERLQRCLNVLREAANEMFNPTMKQGEIEDIDYYEKNKEEDKEDYNDGEEIIFLNKGKKKNLNKPHLKKAPNV